MEVEVEVEVEAGEDCERLPPRTWRQSASSRRALWHGRKEESHGRRGRLRERDSVGIEKEAK